MPWRSSRVQFGCSNDVPMLARDAALKTGAPSMSAYLQRVIVAAIAADLGLDADELTARQPGYGRGLTGRFAGHTTKGDDTVPEPHLHSTREGPS